MEQTEKRGNVLSFSFYNKESVMYTIEIEYTTGNSFGSERRTESVEFVWSTLEDAKEALRRIQEHHQYYKRYRDAGRYAGYHGTKDTQESVLTEAKTKPWYKASEYDTGFEYSVVVPSDDAEHNVLGVFWIGYFEDLHGASITSIDDEDGLSFRC